MELEYDLISGRVSGYINSEYVIKYSKRKQIAHIIYKNGDMVTIFSSCVDNIKRYLKEG